MVTINIHNKNIYLLIAALVFLIGAGIIIAYDSNPPDPAVMGHTANEIGDFENEVIKIINEYNIGEIVCSDTTIASSMDQGGTTWAQKVAYNNVAENVNIPTSFVRNGSTYQVDCSKPSTEATGDDCILKIIYYDNRGPIRFEYCKYNQDTNNRWSCINSGRSGINGYAASVPPDQIYKQISWLFKKWCDKSDCAHKFIGLADDFYGERANNKWAFRDKWNAAGEEIFICIDNSGDVVE